MKPEKQKSEEEKIEEEKKKLEEEKKRVRESGDDFRFHSRLLKRELTERAAWNGHQENMQNALAALNKKSLSQKDKEEIRAALQKHKGIAEAYHVAGVHAQALFEILDEAANLYKKGNRGHAKMLAWSTGRRGKTEDHASIVATYILQTAMGVSRNEAIKNIAELFHMTSPGAVIDILKRNKKKFPLAFPRLPGNWPKN
mgnify:CR=1 FL=1